MSIQSTTPSDWSKACLLGLIALVATACAGPQRTHPGPASPLERARAQARLDEATATLAETGDPVAAARTLADALAADPDNPRIRLWAAWVAELAADEEAAFEHYLAASRSNDPTAELAIWSAYRSATTRSQIERLADVLADAAERPAAPPLVRARAQHFLGHCSRHLGRFAAADRAFARLGYVRDWMLVGPFDNDQNAGFQTAYPPERGPVELDQSYPGKLHRVGWRPVELFSPDGRVSLRALLDPARWSTAYLATWINSPDQRQVAIRLAAYRGVKVWLNGELLLADDQARLAALDQYAAPARLRAGWNSLLVKVCQRTGPWQLGLRLTAPDGEPLRGLRTSTRAHPSAPASASGPPPVTAQTFESWLAAQAPDDFTRAAGILWSLRQGFTPQATRRAEAWVATRPGCPLAQLLLARAHFAAGRSGNALKALAAAQHSGTMVPAVLLERARYEQRQSRADRALRIIAPLLAQDRISPATRVVHISLLAARGWQTDALRQAQALSRLQPDRAGVWRMIGDRRFKLLQTARGIAAYRRALSLRADHKGTYDGLITRQLLAGRLTRAIWLVRRRTRVFPHLMTSAAQEARLLLAAGRPAEGLAVCDRIERIAPDFWLVHKLRGDILYRSGDRDAALAAYRRSLVSTPDNPQLQEYVDHLVHRPDEIFERYGLGHEAVEAILAARRDPGQYAGADAVFLLDDLVSHVFADGSARHQVRQVYWVLNEKGQRRLSEFRVPSSSSFRLEVAETIQPDGHRQEATSIRRGVIHLPSLEPGSLIHVAYSYHSASRTWMQDHYADSFSFQGPDPVRRSRWVLALPAERKLHIQQRGQWIEHRVERQADTRIHTWTATDVPMLHSEPWRPPLRELRAAVYVSTVPDWATLARWHNSLLQDQFEIDDAIRAKTDELVAGLQTPAEKLEAVYRFVAKQIRYLDNDVGIFGKKPNQAVNVFANRFGDCKDKATLMIAMLRHLGLEAHYAAVRTREAGPIFWQVPYAQTNHIITYLPAQPGLPSARFVDATASYNNVDYLPERDQGLKALVLTGDGHELVETPDLGPEASTRRVTLSAHLTEDQGLSVQATESWRGWFATRLRTDLHTEGKRTEVFARKVSARFPGATLGPVRFSGLDELLPEASAAYSFQVPGAVRAEGDSLRLKLLWPLELTDRMARRPARHHDFLNIWDMTSRVSASLQIPAGYRVAHLPAEVEVEAGAFHYRLACREQGASVTCEREFVMPNSRIPPEAYEAFRKRCGQVDQAERQDIVLEPIDQQRSP